MSPGRRMTKREREREIFACARMVDSVAAQLLMLGEDACLTDAEHDELEDLGQATRRVAEDLYAKIGIPMKVGP